MPLIEQREMTPGQWAALNPVLLKGEIGWESGATPKAKKGDGTTAYNDLPYVILPPVDTSSFAPKDSPVLTGSPKAPTPATPTNDTSIATAEFVKAVVALFAPLNSPVLTGNPTAPTASPGDNDTTIATTGFVQAALAGGGGLAPLASPVFTGNPTAPTPTAGDNDTSLATTAFVSTAIGANAASKPTFVTSTTRPASPVGGQRIYETDTGNYLIYSGTAWRVIGTRQICTSSTRPTGGMLFEGLRIYETDTGREYIYAGGTWVQQGVLGELGYAQIVAGWSNPSPTTMTDVPGLSITVTVGARPIWLEFATALTHVSTGAGYLIGNLREGSTVVQRGFTDKNDNRLSTVTAGVRLTPSAGTHTYKLSVLTDGVAGCDVFADTQTPAWIRASEI